MEKELPLLLNEYGVSSVKMFMTYPSMMLKDSELLEAMIMCRRHGITVLLHAENGDMIEWMTDALEECNMIAPFYHAQSRPPIVEAEATNRAIALAQYVDTPIVFVHMSAPAAVDLLRESRANGLSVFGETCTQYVMLTEEDLQGTDDDHFSGAKCVCSPPPRHSKADWDAIWKGMSNGTFTLLSSDHAPTNYDSPVGKKIALSEEKGGKFRYVPNGIPGVETRMPLIYTYGVMEGRITIEKFVELLCTNPAKLYGMYPQKGTILPGVSDADLCIWYPDGSYGEVPLTNSKLHHNVDYTPFEGKIVKNWPRYTLVRGKVIWKEGKLVGEKGTGKFVKRGRSKLAKPRDQWLTEWRPPSHLEMTSK